MADLLGTVATVDKEKAGLLQEQYAKEVERYNKEKDEIEREGEGFGSRNARRWRSARTVTMRRRWC